MAGRHATEMVAAGADSGRNHEPLIDSVVPLQDAVREAPRLEGVPTGVEGLDDLFFTTHMDAGGKPVRRPLGGIPRYAVLNLTGVSDTGKSLMAEQFAVTQAARGKPTLFLTVETPAPFVAASLRERARAMGLDFAAIEPNLILIDAASHSVLRDDLPTLLQTLAYAIKRYRIQFTVIDSVTGLYEAREMTARQTVRRLYNFLKKWYQTALLVSQKRSGHEELSAEAAGGYAVAHIVDGTLVVAKKSILSAYDERLYGVPMGEVVRLFRIDGCRMSGHDTSTHVLEITETGLVRIGPTLQQMLASHRKRR